MISLLATIVILMIILLMTISIIRAENNQCFYEYTDSNGNTGCSNYCGMENGNLYCNATTGFGKISVVKFNERRGN